MLTEQTIIDQILVLPDGQINLRETTLVYRDGIFLSKSYHRRSVNPGDDLAHEDARVVAHCALAHTPAAIEAYRATLRREEG